jgi:hypothetical protein
LKKLKCKAAYNQAKEDAMYLTQLSLASGNSFDAALHFGAPHLHGGFVYSPDEIKSPCSASAASKRPGPASILRRNRLGKNLGNDPISQAKPRPVRRYVR